MHLKHFKIYAVFYLCIVIHKRIQHWKKGELHHGLQRKRLKKKQYDDIVLDQRAVLTSEKKYFQTALTKSTWPVTLQAIQSKWRILTVKASKTSTPYCWQRIHMFSFIIQCIFRTAGFRLPTFQCEITYHTKSHQTTNCTNTKLQLERCGRSSYAVLSIHPHVPRYH